jgi:hypothetical protein
MKTPFKMKGSPMARNFGISPAKQVQGKPLSESSKKAMEMVKQNQKIDLEENKDQMQDQTDSGSFDKAFAAARKRGVKAFTYKGKSYNTKLKKKAPTPPISAPSQEDSLPS